MRNEPDLHKRITELTDSATDLLDELASQNQPASDQQVKDLDWHASELAKLAYGNNRPEYIEEEMRSLISWCDHIHEAEVHEQFVASLRNRPLVMPLWSSS